MNDNTPPSDVGGGEKLSQQTGWENPEFFLTGPTHHYTIQAIRIGGAQ